MTKVIRAAVRGKRTSVRGRTVRTKKDDPNPQLLPTKLTGRRASARLLGRGGSRRTGAAKPKASAKPATLIRKGGAVPGTPSPMRTRMSAELQAHVRWLYEETDQPICQIALDVGVNESVIRRMGPREGWVRYVAPPRGLPPVAKLLAQVEELEEAVKVDRHPDVLPEGEPRRMAGAVALRGSQVLAPQGDGESAELDATQNIARFTQVVMAHLDEFEAMRRDGKLLPKHHLETARAISILTEAFNRLARLRAALPGTIHDDSVSADKYAILPADLDAFREELAQRIEKFIASRTDPGAFADVAAAPPERADE